MRSAHSVLLLLVLYALSASAAEPDVSKSPLLQLYEKIVPEVGHIRPPYDLARYDMGLKTDERPSLDTMRVTAVARQNALAAEYHTLEDSITAAPPRDARDIARWTLLQYAFGREKLETALEAARTFGPAARLDLSRLLLKECRFNEAVEQLMELCDGPAPESRVALALLANHQSERNALAARVSLVPLRTDLDAFLRQQEQKPERAAMLSALRGLPAPQLRPDRYQATLEASDVIMPRDILSDILLGESSDAVGRNPDPQTLNQAYIVSDSVDLLITEDAVRTVPQMRAESGYYIDTPRFHFTSTCNGEIQFTVYRFESRSEFQSFRAAKLKDLKPLRTWTHQYRDLAANNTQARWDDTVAVEDASEGYYALTAQARYSSELAIQTFAVSQTALYVHAAANRVVITALHRRTGQPIPDISLQTEIVSTYAGNRIKRGETRTDAFMQGLNGFGLNGLSIHELNPLQLSESLGEYAKGAASRTIREAILQKHTLKTDAMGTATLDVDFSDVEFVHQITASVQGPLVARVETSFSVQEPDKSTLLTVAWAARPLYRPGELVNLKGIVREFDGLRVSRDEMLRQVLVEVASSETKLFSGTVPISATGSFKLDVPVPEDADLGDYYVRVNGKPTSSSGKIFSVSHFRVPQYTVAVTLDRATWKQGETATGTAIVKYVTGKPVIGASVELLLGDNPVRTLITGPDGRCPISVRLGSYDRESSALITAMAVDSSAQIAIGSTRATVTPFDFRFTVGSTRWERSARNVNEIIIPVEARNLKGEPLAGVLVTSSDREDTRRVITDAHGSAELRVEIAQTKDRVELRLVAMFNQQVIKYPVYSAFPNEILTNQRSNELTLQASGVDAGKPISVTLDVQPAHDGPALVALFVENTRMFEHRIVSLPAGKHTLEFKTDASYAPEVTVTGVLLASPSVTVAKRAVTVIPREQFLTIEVMHDREEYQPGQECVATVRAKNFRGEVVPHAEISLGVVHEGIYALAEDTTPDLLRFFHVHTMPVYSSSVFDRPSVQSRSEIWFLGPKYGWGYSSHDYLGSGHGSFGSRSGGGRRLMVKRHGGSRATEYGSRTRSDFRATAHWVADLVTGADGTATVRFKFPDDITDWRFTARGVTADTLVGHVTAHCRTFLPLQTELALPRGLRAGDRVEASVIAQNNVAEERTVALAFESPFGKSEQKLKLAPNGSGRLPIALAPTEAGILTLRGMVQGKDKSGDSIERSLDVLPGGFPSARTHFGILKERADIPLEFGPAAIAKSQRLELQFDSGAAGAVSSALESLIQYPYGCVEQTMSRFMPAVVAGRAIERAGLPFQQADKLKEVFSKGLVRLRQFQHSDGGWGWWERDATNAFMTAYVLEGLVLCEEAGQPVPKSMLTRAQTHLSQVLKQEFIEVTPVSSIGETDLKTYVLAVLARCHQRHGTLTPELTADFQKALRVKIDRPWTPRELALRADALLRLGDTAHATETLRAAANDFKLDPYNRGSVLCAANLLEIGTLLKDASVPVDALALTLLQARRGHSWQDTLTTAAAVRGLSCMLVKSDAQTSSKVEVLVGGRAVKTLELNAGGRVSLALGDELQGATQVGLRLISGPAPTWTARAYHRLATPPPPPDEPKATITTRVFALTPNERELATDANGHLVVPAGTTLRVELHCTLTEDQRLLRVTFPRPCGVELVQPPKSVKSAAPWELRKSTVQNVVDFDETPDALHFFVDQWLQGDHKIEFTVRAEMSGNVLAPLPELEPMYDLIKVKSEAPTRWIMTDKK